jgi:hypothetical protein
MAGIKVRKGRSHKRSRVMSRRKTRQRRRMSRGGKFTLGSLTRPLHSWRKSKYKKATDGSRTKYNYNHNLKESGKPYFNRWEPTETEIQEQAEILRFEKLEAAKKRAEMNLKNFSIRNARDRFNALEKPTKKQIHASPYLGGKS